jgi:hypothetical protein
MGTIVSKRTANSTDQGTDLEKVVSLYFNDEEWDYLLSQAPFRHAITQPETLGSKIALVRLGVDLLEKRRLFDSGEG